MPIVLVILAMLVMAAVALAAMWLVVIGFRGTPVRSTPSCAQCRYDLSGHDTRPSSCPECGSDLWRPHAVRVRHRQPRLGPMAVGAAILILMFSPLALVFVPKPPAPAAAATTPLPVVAVRSRSTLFLIGPTEPAPPVTAPPIMAPLAERMLGSDPGPPRTFTEPVIVISSLADPGSGAGISLQQLTGDQSFDDAAFTFMKMTPPSEPLGTWEPRRHGALADLPSGRNPSVVRWSRQHATPLFSYPSSTTSRSASHSSTLLRR